MANTNTYSGGTIVQSGQLNINYGGDGSLNSAIGTGPLTLALGSKLDNTSGQPVTLLTPIAENWQDDWTFLGTSSLNTGSGTITLGSSIITLTVVSNTLEVDGQVQDNGNNNKIQKMGAGALTLKTDNSFGGGVELAAGVLNLGSAYCLGVGILTIDGGAIDNVSGADFTLGAIGAISVPIPSGGGWSFLGTTNLDLGTAPMTPNSGCTMTWNIVSNALTLSGDILSGNTLITKIGKGTLVLAGFSTVNQMNLMVNDGEVDLAHDAGSAIGTGGGTPGLFAQSNSVVKITGGGGNQIIGTGYIQTRLSSGAVFDLNGQSESLDMLTMTNSTLRNSSVGGNSTLTIVGTAGTHPTNAVTLTGVNQLDVPDTNAVLTVDSIVNGTGSLVKTGLGAATLMQSNNFTGNLTVGGGTLTITYPDLAATATVVVSNSAVLNLNFANSETNTVSALVLGGVSKPNGLYNATTDPLYITGMGSLQVTPAVNPLPGTIQFSVSGSTLSLAWPTNSGWILQSETNLSSHAWVDVAGSGGVTATNITVNPTNPTVFFRLRSPTP
jgi:autotransporter-associated beta strand protein